MLQRFETAPPLLHRCQQSRRPCHPVWAPEPSHHPTGCPGAPEGALVPHGQPVEPVVVPPVTHLERRWSGPHQGAGEPGRDRTSDGQVVQAGFPVQRPAPHLRGRPVRGGVSRHALVTCVRGGIERAGHAR
jgi:hypothetical protein